MNAKTKRNQRLYEYRQKHKITLLGLVRMFHITYKGKPISKQRISQILQKEAKRNKWKLEIQ